MYELFTEAGSADAVIERLDKCPDPRFAEVMGSAIRHLHAFVKELLYPYVADILDFHGDEVYEFYADCFRHGQTLFGTAVKALRAEDWDAALAAGRECRDAALSLGDWWGAAMDPLIMP